MMKLKNYLNYKIVILLFIIQSFIDILSPFHIKMSLISLGVWGIIYILIALILNRRIIALGVTTAISAIINLCGFIKEAFFPTPLIASDFILLSSNPLVIKDLINNYFSYSYLFFLIVFIAYLFFILKITFVKNDTVTNSRKCHLGMILFALTACYFIISGFVRENTKLERNVSDFLAWTSKRGEGYKRDYPSKCCGTLLTLFKSLSYTDVKLRAATIGSEFIKNKITQSSSVDESFLPDIVLILFESAFNINYLQNIEVPNLKMFDKKEISIKDLNVHVFGGGTNLTEFSSLTGINPLDIINSNNHFYAMLYQFNDSLPLVLKQYNYENSMIIGTKGEFLGVKNFSKYYGFDHFYDTASFNHKRKNNWVKEDKLIFERVLDILKQDEEKPKFILAETLQNHGPHGKIQSPNSRNCNYDKDVCNKLNDYLDRQTIIDNEFSKILDFINNRKKPTIVIYYGDHYPAFEGKMKEVKLNTDFYNTLYGIKSNFNLEVNLPEKMDIIYLPGLILDITKKNSSPYWQTNSYLRKTCQGKYKNCDNQKLVVSYIDLIVEKVKELYK